MRRQGQGQARHGQARILHESVGGQLGHGRLFALPGAGHAPQRQGLGQCVGVQGEQGHGVQWGRRGLLQAWAG